jgi:hypothetical protein
MRAFDAVASPIADGTAIFVAQIVGRYVGIAALTIGWIALIRDALSATLAGVRLTQIGIDTDTVVANPCPTHVVAGPSGIEATLTFAGLRIARAVDRALVVIVAVDACAQVDTAGSRSPSDAPSAGRPASATRASCPRGTAVAPFALLTCASAPCGRPNGKDE